MLLPAFMGRLYSIILMVSRSSLYSAVMLPPMRCMRERAMDSPRPVE